MEKSLKNKVIIITGASSGIGEAVAYELAQAHANIVLAARRVSRLRKAARRAAPTAAGVLVVDTDISKYGEVKRLVRRTYKRFGRIDVLLNIAGWGSYSWFDKQTAMDIKEQYEANVLGHVYTIHEVLPIMLEQRSGHIINMVSYASRVAVPPMTVYASTKYALEGLTDALRRELCAGGLEDRQRPAARKHRQIRAAPAPPLGPDSLGLTKANQVTIRSHGRRSTSNRTATR